MKKVCVVGHFGFGENMLNGQTIKTKTVTTELEKQLGADQVMKIDTHGGAKALPKITVQLINAFKNCKNIIIFPAHNGIRVFVPLCNAINKVFHRKLHYVVIGGWLHSLLANNKGLADQLRKFDGIYVETTVMCNSLVKMSFSNAVILPNFKDIQIITDHELVFPKDEPYRLCTFSRVMKEKGIEDAINAVSTINLKSNRNIFELDIYGQVDSEQIEWFETIKQKFPNYVHYRGTVEYNQSVEVLKNYYALLFPTNFYTEGIPGTIIDGYAAGIPVISAKWESFDDVVEDGITGMGYSFGDNNAFEKILSELAENPSIVIRQKKECIRKAKEYGPKVISNILIPNLD